MSRSGCSRSALSVIATGVLGITGCHATESGTRVQVGHEEGRYELLYDGAPFFIRGAGGQSRLDLLAESGGNSIRTWSSDNLGDVLERADKHGLKVTAGIWLGHPRHGFDYTDDQAVREQLKMIELVVLAHKDHPALLMWGVGNELELMSDPDLVFPHINDAAKLIKKLDPNHPTMAVLAGTGENKIAAFVRDCPDVDVLGVNAYGEIVNVPDELNRQGYTGPYVVTEFGPRGHWESKKADWGAPVEPTGAAKAEMYRKGYERAVLGLPDRCLGSYAFLWGNKQETTATWFGLLLPTGERTQACDVLQEMWTNQPAQNRCPVVKSISSDLALARVGQGESIRASVDAVDPDGDPLVCDWSVVAETRDRRSGGDAEAKPPVMEGAVVSSSGLEAVVRTPDEPGPYRLFVTVRDKRGNAGTANVPFYVE